MLENQLGKIVEYERRRTGISGIELCSGLCSPTFLLRIETGERRCEKVLADALLQRMGVPSGKFVYIMNPDEEEWLLARERLVQAVDAGDMEKAQPFIERYKSVTAGKSKLHRQFLLLAEVVLEWKNGCECKELQSKLKEAFHITMPGINWCDVENKRMSLTELLLVIMHGRIAEEQDNLDVAERIYAIVLASMIRYVSPQDYVRIYAQIVYRLVNLLKERSAYQIALQYVENGIELLKQQGNITYMRQLLEQYIVLQRLVIGEDISKEKQREICQMQEACASLKWLYERYQVPEMPWVWNIPFSMGEIELCRDVIKRRRKVLGMSQEELSEGICDPVSVSRIECGKVKPKTEVLKKLMKKVGMSGGSFISWYQVNNPQLLEMANEISNCLAMGNLQKAENLVNELEKIIDLENIYVRQYFYCIKALTLLNLGEIDKEKHWEMQEKALYFTLPKVPLDKLQNWVFSSQEVESVNMLSYSCEAVGKQEQIIRMLGLVLQSYREKVFSLEYYVAGVGLTARNLGNILGNLGKYEDAIETTDYGIYWALRRGDGVLLKTLLYDRGWDMEHLWERSIYTQKESLKYIEASLMLNIMFGFEKKVMFVKKHIEQTYE